MGVKILSLTSSSDKAGTICFARRGLLDARIAWTNSSGRLQIALRGSNLTDRVWVSQVYSLAGEAIAAFGDPRTHGVRFDWRY